jgi:hypothetical protein
MAPAFDLNPFLERVRELKTWLGDQKSMAWSRAGQRRGGRLA